MSDPNTAEPNAPGQAVPESASPEKTASAAIPNPERIDITPVELLERVADLRHGGFRLVQVSCTKTDVYEMNYSFDLDYRFVNLKMIFTGPVELPSITDIYPGAFLYENEIHELFNLTIRGINIDYRGTLYKTDIKHPFVPDAPSGAAGE